MYSVHAKCHILLTLQTPIDKARAAKNKGNKYFKAQKYNEAIKCYDSAIEQCPSDEAQDLSTFHQNRAAAHEQLVRSNGCKVETNMVLVDLSPPRSCTIAISLH